MGLARVSGSVGGGGAGGVWSMVCSEWHAQVDGY